MTATTPEATPAATPASTRVPTPPATGLARPPTTVALTGEIDLATSADARAALLGAVDAVDAASAGLLVDLSRVTFLDASGLAVLVAARRRARGRGIAFAVVAPSRSARLALRASGLWRLLEVRDAVPPQAGPSAARAGGLTAG